VHVDEAVDARCVKKVFDVSGLWLAEYLGSAIHIAALRTRCLSLSHPPEDIEVAVKIHAHTFSARIDGKVLAPHIVGCHCIHATVRVDAWHKPNVEGFQEKLDFGGGPGAAAIYNVGPIDMANE